MAVFCLKGRIAQLVRALRLHRRGPGFESLCAHKNKKRPFGLFLFGILKDTFLIKIFFTNILIKIYYLFTICYNYSKGFQLKTNKNKNMKKLTTLDLIVLILTIVGALNWGLVGVFKFDLVAAIFGDMSVISRIVYSLVGISAIYLACIFPNLTKK